MKSAEVEREVPAESGAAQRDRHKCEQEQQHCPSSG